MSPNELVTRIQVSGDIHLIADELDRFGQDWTGRNSFRQNLITNAVAALAFADSTEDPNFLKAVIVRNGIDAAKYDTRDLDLEIWKTRLRLANPKIIELPKYSGKEGSGLFHVLTVELAKHFPKNAITHAWIVALKGDARRIKVTSVKTWKRSPERVEIGLKYGLYETGKFDEIDIQQGRLLVEVE